MDEIEFPLCPYCKTQTDPYKSVKCPGCGKHLFSRKSTCSNPECPKSGQCYGECARNF